MKIFQSLIRFVSLDKILRIKICHMVANENPEVIEGRQRLISKNVPDPDKAAEYYSIDDDGAAFDEEDVSALGEVVVITCVTKVGTNRWKRYNML